MTTRKSTILQIDRAIGTSLFAVRAFHVAAGSILSFAFFLLAVDHSLVSIFAAIFVSIVGAGGSMILAEVALDRANKGKILLSARVAAQQQQRHNGTLLGAVYPINEDQDQIS